MTDPPQFGNSANGWPPPPPPGYYPPPMPGYGGVPGYGFHPITGEPLSDKSKTTAGLLQLLGLICILGIGRIYAGQTGLGVAQLVICLVLLPFFGLGYLVAVVWGIVDLIVLMTGSPRDQYGRLLRDGA